jgi:hypothetical protein
LSWGSPTGSESRGTDIGRLLVCQRLHRLDRLWRKWCWGAFSFIILFDSGFDTCNVTSERDRRVGTKCNASTLPMKW